MPDDDDDDSCQPRDIIEPWHPTVEDPEILDFILAASKPTQPTSYLNACATALCKGWPVHLALTSLGKMVIFWLVEDPAPSSPSIDGGNACGEVLSVACA